MAPSLGILAFVEGLSFLIPSRSSFLMASVGASLLVISVAVLRTRDAIRTFPALAPFDLFICRFAAPLCLLPLPAFLALALYLESRHLDPNTVIFGNPLGWLLTAATMEWGLVLAMAAILVPREMRPIPPIAFWKPVSALAAALYLLYLLGTITHGFGTA